MFVLTCKDLDILNCHYVARADTEDKVILDMMEHAMIAHPEKIKELTEVMSKEEIIAMMREKIQQEFTSE
jgi:predicted small metal-binding protein